MYPHNSQEDLHLIRLRYDKYFKDDVEVDGEVDLDRIKAELSDYIDTADKLSTLVDNLTGGQMSQHKYLLHDMLAEIQEQRNRERLDIIEDELDMGIVRIDTFNDETIDDLAEFIRDGIKNDPEELALAILEYFQVNSLKGDPK